MQWCLAVLDATKSKLYFPIPPKKSRKPLENICHIELSNKAAVLINPFTIFNNLSVTSKLNETHI